MGDLNKIKERLERFCVMKSLVDSGRYKVASGFNQIRVLKDEYEYLVIYEYWELDEPLYILTI